MSVHIVADFFGVDPELIKHVEKMKLLVDPIPIKAGLTVLDSKYHQFKPFGVSCVYLLAESHISIHTWPELGYMAIDIFTCGDNSKAFKTFEMLRDIFKPKEVKKHIIYRDYYKTLPKQMV